MTTPSLNTTCGYGASCLRKAAGLSDLVGDVERVEVLTGNTRQWFHPECRATVDTAVRQVAVAVGLTPTLLADARHRRSSITIQNPGSSSVTIGYGPRALTDLTIANGIKVPAGGSLVETEYTGPVYGMGAVAVTVNVLEVGS